MITPLGKPITLEPYSVALMHLDYTLSQREAFRGKRSGNHLNCTNLCDSISTTSEKKQTELLWRIVQCANLGLTWGSLDSSYAVLKNRTGVPEVAKALKMYCQHG